MNGFVFLNISLSSEFHNNRLNAQQATCLAKYIMYTKYAKYAKQMNIPFQ